MNWKKIGIYFWPLLSWPSMVLTLSLAISLRTGKPPRPPKFFILDMFYDTLFNVAFPHLTIPVLFLFALNCYLWLRFPNWKTFLGTLFTSWGILGPIGMLYIGLAHFRRAVPMHILPLSIRVFIIALVAASPYILLLIHQKRRAGHI